MFFACSTWERVIKRFINPESQLKLLSPQPTSRQHEISSSKYVLWLYWPDRKQLYQNGRHTAICQRGRNSNSHRQQFPINDLVRQTNKYKREKMEDYLANKQLYIINEESESTTYHSRRGKSNIDLTITNNRLLRAVKGWQISSEDSCSDHNF